MVLRKYDRIVAFSKAATCETAAFPRSLPAELIQARLRRLFPPDQLEAAPPSLARSRGGDFDFGLLFAGRHKFKEPGVDSMELGIESHR